MTRMIGLLVLHLVCLYFLQLLWKDKNEVLWKDKNEALKRGFVMTKMGHVSKSKSPRLFYFSIRIDFLVLLALYAAFIVYSIVFLSRGSEGCFTTCPTAMAL